MTIAIATGRLDLGAVKPATAPAPRSPRRRLLKRVLIATGMVVFALVASIGALVGISLYKIDHAVHHVAVPAWLLAEGKNDLLAIVKGPNHSEEAYVFHQVGGQTRVLTIPSELVLPLASGHTASLGSLSLHAPATIIAGLRRLGIPVTHYVGVDLHMVSPSSNLGRLATGTLSVTSLMTDPTGTTSLLEQVASHMYLGPGTPVSAVLALMNVPTAHPVSVPTSSDGHGKVVPASAFTAVLRSFL